MLGDILNGVVLLRTSDCVSSQFIITQLIFINWQKQQSQGSPLVAVICTLELLKFNRRYKFPPAEKAPLSENSTLCTEFSRPHLPWLSNWVDGLVVMVSIAIICQIPVGRGYGRA